MGSIVYDADRNIEIGFDTTLICNCGQGLIINCMKKCSKCGQEFIKVYKGNHILVMNIPEYRDKGRLYGWRPVLPSLKG